MTVHCAMTSRRRQDGGLGQGHRRLQAAVDRGLRHSAPRACPSRATASPRSRRSAWPTPIRSTTTASAAAIILTAQRRGAGRADRPGHLRQLQGRGERPGPADGARPDGPRHPGQLDHAGHFRHPADARDKERNPAVWDQLTPACRSPSASASPRSSPRWCSKSPATATSTATSSASTAGIRMPPKVALRQLGQLRRGPRRSGRADRRPSRGAPHRAGR